MLNGLFYEKPSLVESTFKGSLMRKVSNVFWISVFLAVITLFLGTIAPKGFENVTGIIEDYITSSFGWY